MLSKYEPKTQSSSALTINTLSYVQSPNIRMGFFLSVLNKLKAQTVSKRPIHKGEKNGAAAVDGEDR